MDGRSGRGALAAAVLLLVPAGAAAGPLTATAPVAVSSEGTSPLGGCELDDKDEQEGTNFTSSEVEPFVDVNPANSDNLVGTWQQDRWSNGGSRGNLVATSSDGGASWTQVTQTKSSACTGGPPEFVRASDPWVSFSPDGTAYLMTLAIGAPPPEGGLPDLDAMLVSRSTDGGETWTGPIELIRDETATRFNDKNTLTADPNDSDFAYAVWDRLEFANERAARQAAENTLAFRGPVLFTRTTDGGENWEEPRPIFDPGQENQTIANQIAVLPDNEAFDGELVNIFNLIVNFQEGRFFRSGRFRAAVLRSLDQGATWSKEPVIIDEMRPIDIEDPVTGTGVRDGGIIPDIAVDRTTGTLYAAWMDGRFSGGDHNDIALATSTDGGMTWTGPVAVNATPGSGFNGHAFTASVHVAPDGTVGVSYYDFRNNGTGDQAGDPLETDHFIVHCHSPDPTDAGDLCGDTGGWDETRITAASFDLRKAPVAGGFFLGDYVGLAHTGDSFASLFTRSNTTADPATQYFSRISISP